MRMINLFKLMILGVVGITVACSLAPEVESEMAQRTKDVLDLKQQASTPDEPVPDDVVRVKDDIWLGDTSTVEFEGQPIPAYLEAKDGVTLVSNRPITLYEIGTMLSKITSIAVRYAPELTGEGNSSSRIKLYESADENEPKIADFGNLWTTSEKMVVNYKGPLSGLLDEIANRFGIWWKYEKNEVYFYKYITKTFVLYSLPTKISLSAGAEATEGNTSQSTEAETIAIWDKIGETLEKMIDDGGEVSMDPASGTITVVATPSNIRQIAKFVNEQNNRLSKQVAISVKVFQLSIENSDNFQFDLTAVFSRGDELGVNGYRNISANEIGYTNSAMNLLNPEKGFKDLSMGITSGRWSVAAAMGALSKEGQTHLVTSGTVTTMNNKPAPINVTKKQKYLSGVTVESQSEGSDNSNVSTETEEVETGFMMSVLPRILDHGRLMIFFNLSLSDLLDLTEYKAGKETIYAPITETREFTQEVALKSGDTLILAGYERTEDDLDKSGVGSPDNMFPGGALAAKKSRTLLIIMLTPVVMESPLSPESRMRD